MDVDWALLSLKIHARVQFTMIFCQLNHEYSEAMYSSEMRDSESQSRVEAVIELYKRISRGWKKKSLLSVQPLKRVSTELQAQVIFRTNCGTSSHGTGEKIW